MGPIPPYLAIQAPSSSVTVFSPSQAPSSQLQLCPCFLTSAPSHHFPSPPSCPIPAILCQPHPLPLADHLAIQTCFSPADYPTSIHRVLWIPF